MKELTLNKQEFDQRMSKFENQSPSKVNINKLDEFDNAVKNVEFSEPSLQFYYRKKISKVRLNALKAQGKNCTKWDMFYNDVMSDENPKAEPLKKILNVLNDENIPVEKLENVISTAEKELKSEEVLTYINSLQVFDKDRLNTELSKKLKHLRTKLNRNIPNDFGVWIDQLRKSRGLSFRALQEKSGVSASYIHRIISGERQRPTIPVIEQLAEALGVDKAEFFTKLNMKPTESEKEQTISQLLSLNDYTINGVSVTRKQKTAILELLTGIINAKWSTETQFDESIQIMKSIGTLKKALVEDEE
ncbi:helix-turn-helix domain-containing protein [Inconstantimicrobium porci]|uniref:Helix-turn-helix domain-containing protein n=1 Tax=Inconstantimicrobium porci TaxID=2652291 RepID=A0A7X2MZL2_9CLOT|nr:helix-turn-helix transcriptional regulator [Inconstantimicrobium porci]MSR91990.1 helix-turn-helix domain-containing protein [Inconstantimicrobium porci]